MKTSNKTKWAHKPRIYIENIRERDKAYYISSEAVLKSLHEFCQPSKITCRYSDEPQIDAFRCADILISGRLNTDLISREAHELMLIQCTSAGVEQYHPFDWMAPQTSLTNASGVHARKAAEFGLMGALMLHNRVPVVSSQQRNHVWSRQLRSTAEGVCVLLYGVGAIGSAIAERLQGAGFCVNGVRRSGAPVASVDKMFKSDELHQALRTTDILILSCPLTKETYRVIGARELSLLPNGAGVLNLSRGRVIDVDALVTSLESNHLSGAILDVFDQEPLPPASPLWDVPNLMVFPHVSADDPNGYINRCLEVLRDNIPRAQAGLPLRNLVDPTLGY